MEERKRSWSCLNQAVKNVAPRRRILLLPESGDRAGWSKKQDCPESHGDGFLRAALPKTGSPGREMDPGGAREEPTSREAMCDGLGSGA